MNVDPLPVSSDQDPQIHRLMSEVLAEIFERYQLDLSQDPVAMERILDALRKARLDLESNLDTEINLPFISANSSGPIHYRRLVTRRDFGLAEKEPDDSTGNDVQDNVGAEPQKVQIELPERRSLITISLLVITILIYGIQLLTDLTLGYDLPAALGLKSNALIMAGQYWRLVTPMFLHGSILHLGFNMYALYILGRRVERYFGSARFLGLYLIAGFTGNVFSFIFTQASSLGSSTAVFGLLGAEGVFIYQHRKLFGSQSRLALRQIIQVAVINLLIGLSPGIDNWGHVGGLIGGAIFAVFAGPLFVLKRDGDLIRLNDRRLPTLAWVTLLIQIVLLSVWTAMIIQARS